MSDTSNADINNQLENGAFVPPELRSAKYSNRVQINVSNVDVVLNFLYINPNDVPQGTLVSRVAIPLLQAAELSKILKDALEQIQALADSKNKEGK